MNNWGKIFGSRAQISVMDSVCSLVSRVEKLEEENVQLTNELYELQNKLDMMENPHRVIEIPETAETAYIDMIRKGYTMTADGFWMPPESCVQKVELDGLTGELYITIPDKFLDKMGWKENDQLEWIDRENGSFELRKI
jgi:hypothetical protein